MENDLDDLYTQWLEYKNESIACGLEYEPWDEYSGQTTARQKAEERIMFYDDWNDMEY